VADDWPCADSSACIVAGEICELALNPVVAGPAFAVVEAELEISNGLPCPKPVAEAPDCVADDADEASAWMASMALDAAPIANNMINSDTRRLMRHTVHGDMPASAVPRRKTQ